MNIDIRIDGTFMSIASTTPIPASIICDITQAMTEMILQVIDAREKETTEALREKPF